MQMLQPDINQNGSAKAELGRKPSIASANKEYITNLSSRSLRTELSIDKNHLLYNGVLAINLYRKLPTYAKDSNFSRTCSRLVDVRDDMILFC